MGKIRVVEDVTNKVAADAAIKACSGWAKSTSVNETKEDMR